MPLIQRPANGSRPSLPCKETGVFMDGRPGRRKKNPAGLLFVPLKRSLDQAGPQTRVHIGDQAVPMLQLLSEMALALRASLREHSACLRPSPSRSR